MTFNIVTGKDGDDSSAPNTWSWRDEGRPSLTYRQPTAGEYNAYQRAKAKYDDRQRAHFESREGEVEEVLEDIDPEEADLDEDEFRFQLLMAGFFPEEHELEAFVDLLVACTTGLRGFTGEGGEPLDWDDPDLHNHVPGTDSPEEARRWVLRSLGETPQQRIASIFQYARQIALGLEGETKKD